MYTKGEDEDENEDEGKRPTTEIDINSSAGVRAFV